MIVNQSSEEIFPIVDENGKQIGSATRGECHSGSMLLHPVVHLHVFNTLGELFLQRRPAWKDIQPNKWDSGVGGHVDLGEEIEAALKREAFEELGIEDFEPQFICSYIFQSEVEREMVNVFCCIYDGEIKPSVETDGGRFWSKNEIIENLDREIFTPNFENEFKQVILKEMMPK